jgi:hypothetical protein
MVEILKTTWTYNDFTFRAKPAERSAPEPTVLLGLGVVSRWNVHDSPQQKQSFLVLCRQLYNRILALGYSMQGVSVNFRIKL